ncbi:MAG: hypothetical protein Q9206_003097 [Seirophora lacunosa]
MALLALPSPMDSGTTAENAISNTTSPSSGRLLEKLRATRLDPSDLQSRRQLAQQVLELRLPARRLAPTSMSLRLDQVLRQVQALSTLLRRHSHARARMCILACDNYVPDPNIAGGRGCVAATWGFGNPGGNCYLKYEIGQIVYGDPNAASCKLRDYTIPGSVSSLTTRIAATSSTVNPVPATTSSNPSVPQPSYISGTAECPAQNGAIYTDGFGVQYEIACGVEIDGANALSAAHADSFEKCVAFCDLLPGCTAATYPGEVGPDNLFRSNCYLYTSFNAYIPNANPTLRSARVRFGGSNTGDQFNSVGLCPALDGQTYTDPANGVHQIGCERGLAGAADLFAVVLHTLQACITYCSLYTTCVGVTFTGYVPGNRATNCNPRSTYTQVVAQAGNSTAFLSPP